MNVLLAFVIFTGLAWLRRPDGRVPCRRRPARIRRRARPASRPATSLAVGQRRHFDRVRRRRTVIDGHPGSHAGETVTLGDPARRRRRPRACTVTLRSPSPDRRPARAPLGDLGDLRRRVRTGHPHPGRDRRRGDRDRRERTATRSGLILGGLGELVATVVDRPHRPAAGCRPDRHRDPDRRHVLARRAARSRCTSPACCRPTSRVVNILPFPPLDGGRMLVIVLKRFAGRRISLRAERLTYASGSSSCSPSSIWISGFDIARQLGGGSP